MKQKKKKFITKKSFLSARGMTKILMAICIIAFTMPFMTISCGSETFVTLSGFDVMAGKTVWLRDKLVQTSTLSMTDPLIMLAFLAALITFAMAFLPTYPISKPVWGIASAAGLLIIVQYILTASFKIADKAKDIVPYQIPAEVSAIPGTGAVICSLCFVVSLIMLIRKLFFEEPDQLVLTPDEREVYEAIKAEEAEEEPEKERIRHELEKKLAPLEERDKKEEKEKAEENVLEEVEEVEPVVEEPKKKKAGRPKKDKEEKNG